MARTKSDLTKGSILKSLVIFALPILISNIFQQLYNTVDTIIVGNILGESALAAVGACSVVYDLLVGFALGVGSGMSIVVARSFGSGNEDKLKKAVAGSIVIALGLSMSIAVLSQLFLKPLLRLLDTPEDILAEGYSYISTIVTFAAVTVAYNLCAALLRAIGNSFMPLVFLIVSSVLNIGLDVLFIASFGMGVRGAALATVIAQAVSTVLCVVYIARKAKLLVPRRSHFTPDGVLYRELASQGFAVGFMNSIVFAGNVVLQRSINSLGTMVIAGHTAARKLNMFFCMPCGTIGNALSTFASQNYGANQRDRVRKGLRIGFVMVFCWTVIATIVQALFAPALVRMISGSAEEIIIRNASNSLRFAAPFYSMLGVLFICRLSLQSLGKKKIPIISSCIELVGKIIFAALAVPHLGYTGVILCEPLIWCAMTALLLPSLLSHPWLRGKSEK